MNNLVYISLKVLKLFRFYTGSKKNPLEIYQQLRCTWVPKSNTIIWPSILKYGCVQAEYKWDYIIYSKHGSPGCMWCCKCEYKPNVCHKNRRENCDCQRWIRPVHFSFNKCIFGKHFFAGYTLKIAGFAPTAATKCWFYRLSIWCVYHSIPLEAEHTAWGCDANSTSVSRHDCVLFLITTVNSKHLEMHHI